MGIQGYSYYLHELLKNSNKKTKYTFLNYAIGSGNIYSGVPEGEWNSPYHNECRYEQLNKSMANFLVLGFGSCDQIVKNFKKD